MVVTRLCRDPKRADLYKQIDKQVKKMYLYLSSASFSRECKSCNYLRTVPKKWLKQNKKRWQWDCNLIGSSIDFECVFVRSLSNFKRIFRCIVYHFIIFKFLLCRFCWRYPFIVLILVSIDTPFGGKFRKRQLGQTRDILRPSVWWSSAGRRGGWRWIRAASVAATATTSGTACFQADHSVQMTKSEIIFQTYRSIS